MQCKIVQWSTVLLVPSVGFHSEQFRLSVHSCASHSFSFGLKCKVLAWIERCAVLAVYSVIVLFVCTQYIVGLHCASLQCKVLAYSFTVPTFSVQYSADLKCTVYNVSLQCTVPACSVHSTLCSVGCCCVPGLCLLITGIWSHAGGTGDRATCCIVFPAVSQPVHELHILHTGHLCNPW